jgi:hypothetical protein
MKNICRIEIIKDGRNYAARVFLADGPIKEYKHPVFEEALTEMVVDLQDICEEKS